MQPEVQEPELPRTASFYSMIILLQGGYIKGLFHHWYFKVLSIMWSLLYIAVSSYNLYLLIDIIHEITSESKWIEKIDRIADLNLTIISTISHLNFLIIAFFYKVFLMKVTKLEESNGSSLKKVIWIFTWCASFFTILFMAICVLAAYYTDSRVDVQRILLYFKIAFQKCGFACILVLMSSCLCALFHNFTENFKQDMVLSSVPCRDLGQCFEQFRRRYETLVDFVSCCDKFVCVPLGLLLLTDMVYLCLMLYLVFAIQDVDSYFVNNVFFTAFEFLCICISSGVLRIKVKFESLDIFRTNFLKANLNIMNFLCAYNFFLNRIKVLLLQQAQVF